MNIWEVRQAAKPLQDLLPEEKTERDCSRWKPAAKYACNIVSAMLTSPDLPLFIGIHPEMDNLIHIKLRRKNGRTHT